MVRIPIKLKLRFAGVDRKVSCGSLADISGKGYQGCPLYPLKADMLTVSIDVCVPLADITAAMKLGPLLCRLNSSTHSFGNTS